MYYKFIICFLYLFSSSSTFAQFGYGFTVSNDLYHRYVNPKDDIASPSAGSAILNLGVGPKIWIGNKNISFSAEGQAVLGFLTVSSKDNKGLGSIAFPVMAKLNFKGLSTFDKEGKMGFSIGGGFQENRTEFFGLSDEFLAKGVRRNYFKTYIVQAGYGFGLSGFTAHGFLRYGFNPDIKSVSTLNIGLQFDFNRPMLKKITNPESEL
jgi:hypothetical protein